MFKKLHFKIKQIFCREISSIFIIYIVFLVGIAYFFLRKQITNNYLDFGDGNYLYTAWRISLGEIPYRDFLVPHPPILFYLGALLMKITTSIIVVRASLLILYLSGNILFFRIIKRIFKNSLLALLCSAGYFILNLSSLWWLTFTPEVLLRFLLLLHIDILISENVLTYRRKIALIFIGSLMMFTKYTAGPYLAISAGYIFMVDRKFFWKYIFSLAIILVFGIMLLNTVTGGRYLYDTLTIRSAIPRKTANAIILEILNILISYFVFFILNLYLAIISFKKRPVVSFICLIPIFFFINLVITLYEGTYVYIIYPIEPLLLIGYCYLLLSFFSQKNIVTGLRKVVIIFFLLIASLNVVFLLQTFSLMVHGSAFGEDVSSVNRIVSIIKKNSSKKDEILAPPYFAYLSERKIIYNYSESFIYLMDYIYNPTHRKGLNPIILIRKKIMEKKIPMIVFDWRLDFVFKQTLLKTKTYHKKDDIVFYGNSSEVIGIYTK